MSTDFGPLMALLLALAPPDWASMRVAYYYDGGMATISTHVITKDSGERRIDPGQRGFEMMDFFDAYREKTHGSQQRRWTWVSVSIDRENKEPIVEYGYDPPRVLER